MIEGHLAPGVGNEDLRLVEVSHSFGTVQALSGVSIGLSGGVVGLLGPNGAGKSTLMNIASTAMKPQRGEVFVAGHRASGSVEREDARKELGYLPQQFSLMSWGTALRNASYAAWTQGLPPERCEVAAEAALAVVGLEKLKDQRVRTLSGGQRQRLGIACAIVHKPRVLLLDEPTVGLDPVQRAEIRTHLQAVGEGRTVLLSTHIVEDLDRTTQRILVLAEGRIAFDGARAQLIDSYAPPHADGNPLEAAYVRLMQALDRVPSNDA